MIGYSHPVLFVMDSDESAFCVRADFCTEREAAEGETATRRRRCRPVKSERPRQLRFNETFEL